MSLSNRDEENLMTALYASRSGVPKIIAKNSRINDWHFEGSGKFDVWIEFVAFDQYAGCWWCGVYLSDIWSVCSRDEDDRAERYKHCFVKKYVREES